MQLAQAGSSPARTGLGRSRLDGRVVIKRLFFVVALMLRLYCNCDHSPSRASSPSARARNEAASIRTHVRKYRAFVTKLFNMIKVLLLWQMLDIMAIGASECSNNFPAPLNSNCPEPRHVMARSVSVCFVGRVRSWGAPGEETHGSQDGYIVLRPCVHMPGVLEGLIVGSEALSP